MPRNSGFTLIEVLVVGAIISILAGILVPMIMNQIDEAKNARALADCKTCSTSVLLFRVHTGKWPYYKPDDCTIKYDIIQSGTGNNAIDNGTGAWGVGINKTVFGTILNLPGTNPIAVQSCYNNKAQS